MHVFSKGQGLRRQGHYFSVTLKKQNQLYFQQDSQVAKGPIGANKRESKQFLQKAPQGIVSQQMDSKDMEDKVGNTSQSSEILLSK